MDGRTWPIAEAVFAASVSVIRVPQAGRRRISRLSGGSISFAGDLSIVLFDLLDCGCCSFRPLQRAITLPQREQRNHCTNCDTDYPRIEKHGRLRVMKFAPVSTLEELDSLDPAEIMEGYVSAERGDPEPGQNRGKSFWHGWCNRMRDIGVLPQTPETKQLTKEYIASGRLKFPSQTASARPLARTP